MRAQRPLAEASPTIRQLAARLGISVTTVSRCLSGKNIQYRISEETLAKVRQGAKDLGYQPNPLAQGLRLKRTLTLGFLAPDIGNPFFASIAQTITSEARRRGYSVLLWDSQDNTAQEAEGVKTLWRRQVDGLIVCPYGKKAAHLSSAAFNGLPMVLVDRVLPGLDLPTVATDNFSGAKLAVEHLIHHGHQQIACLCGLPGTSTNEERMKGALAAMNAHGLKPHRRLCPGSNFDRESGYLHTREMLKSGLSFTAIFAFGNLIALGALDALREAGKHVPQNYSLVSFDDHPYADHLYAPLTTIAQDNTRLGTEAMRLLFEQIDTGRRTAAQILIPPRLIIRASVTNPKPHLKQP